MRASGTVQPTMAPAWAERNKDHHAGRYRSVDFRRPPDDPVTQPRLLLGQRLWRVHIRRGWTTTPNGRGPAVTVVALIFHSMAGYALERLRFPQRDAIFLAMFPTFLISQPVIIAPLFILARALHMLDSYAGLIIPSIFNAFGIFLLRQFYLAIPRELEEAALIDGAGYFCIWWSIIVPLSRPILSALAILFFLANWNSFLWPPTITSNQDLWMVQVAIASFRQQYNGSWNYVMAASTVVALPTIVMFVIFQKRIIESIKTTGIK